VFNYLKTKKFKQTCSTFFTLPQIQFDICFQLQTFNVKRVLADAATLDQVAGLLRNLFAENAARLLLEVADRLVVVVAAVVGRLTFGGDGFFGNRLDDDGSADDR
jgi:hypothetical protein